MEPNFNIFKTVNFLVLSESEITQIHHATLDILKNTGSIVLNNKVVDLLKKAGCSINVNILKVPPNIVEKAIESAPKQITIFNRNGERAMELESRKVYFGTGPTTPFTLDIYTGKRKMTEVKDIELHTKVADSLQNIDFVMPLGSVSNVNKDVSDIYEFVTTIKYTNE